MAIIKIAVNTQVPCGCSLFYCRG